MLAKPSLSAVHTGVQYYYKEMYALFCTTVKDSALKNRRALYCTGSDGVSTIYSNS